MIPQNLNSKQAEAVKHLGGPLLVAAGAGSGKTKTLTSRLMFFLDKGVPGQSIIAITFTNKAAKEMANRVTNDLQLITYDEVTKNSKTVISHKSSVISMPFIGTFHSLGAKILRANARLFGRTIAFSIYDEGDSLRLIRQIVKAFDLKKEKIGAGLILHHISKIKSEVGEPGGRQTGHKDLDKIFPELYRAYEEKLLKSNAFDFDDLIEKPVRAFLKHEDVLKKYRRQFQYILVDEFQDINKAQYEFIRLLGEKSRNISVVGDDQQSIYSFRGSDFRNFLNFEKDWPGTKVVLLEENYRSSGNIISSASAVIANNKIQKVKNLWTKNEAGELVVVVEHADERSEAGWIAEIILQIVKTQKGSGEISQKPAVAVLYRTNAQSRALEQALIERHVAYEIFGGVRFYDRKEIKDIVACLRFAANPKDSISRERISENFLKKPSAEFIRDLPPKADILNPVELIGYILKTADYFDYLKRSFPNAEERIENIAELTVFASNYKNIHEFLEKITLLQGNETPLGKLKRDEKKSRGTAHLMTIHSAKGLEFDTVIVAGCAEGLLPHGMAYKNSGKDEGIEEERRLMYVAMTRARQKLYLSFSGLGSRFLYEIPPELIEFTSFVSDSHGAEFSDDEERYIILP